jgi:phosphohistidine phosphatase SixA
MIWFLRHAEAEEGSPDEARRLTPKGEKQARIAGAALKALGVKPDLCLSSPRVRSEQTARLACEPLGVEVTIDERLSSGPFDPEELAAGLDDVLLVGHDPDFSTAVHDMTGAQVRMKKGGLAAVDRGELAVLLRPRELKAMAD